MRSTAPGSRQAAYASAGIQLPRTAQAQYDAGPPVPAGQPLEPGDLVFFGSGPTDVEHVGIVIGDGEMVDAPHTGADVERAVPPQPLRLASTYVGATRPSCNRGRRVSIGRAGPARGPFTRMRSLHAFVPRSEHPGRLAIRPHG